MIKVKPTKLKLTKTKRIVNCSLLKEWKNKRDDRNSSNNKN